MSRRIDEKKEQEVLELLKQGCTIRQIEEKVHIGRGTVVRVKQRAEKKYPRRVIYESLATENRRLRKTIERLGDKREIMERIIRAASAAMPSVKPVRAPKAKRRKLNQEFHALRGDEQAGAKVDAIDTNGISSYDLKKYEHYVRFWMQKIIQFKKEDEVALGLNKLIIVHLGDWLEGESIYPGQPFHIVDSITNVIFNTVLPLEIEVMLQLAAIFPEIEIFCICGNHGRAGRKGEHHWHSSFEYMLLRMFQFALKDQSNIKVYISESPSMLVQHGSFTFCYDHGTHLHSNYGVPYYSMDRTYRSLPGLYNQIVDVYICGHRHTPTNLTDNIIMNGSFVGGSDLSVQKLKRHARPVQKIFYLDAEKGINRKTDIYLEDRPRLVADKEGIFTPYV